MASRARSQEEAARAPEAAAVSADVGKAAGREKHAPSRGQRTRMAVRIVALACFLASTPICSPNVVVLSPETSGDITAWFSRIVLGAALAASLVMAILPHALPPSVGTRTADGRGPGERPSAGAREDHSAPTPTRARCQSQEGRAAQRRDLRQGCPGEGDRSRAARWGLYVACGLYLVGCVGDVALLGMGGLPSDLALALTVACAVLAGASLPALSVAWASLFERVRLAQLIIIVGGCAAGGALANTLFDLGSPAMARGARVVLLAVGTLYLAGAVRSGSGAAREAQGTQAIRAHNAEDVGGAATVPVPACSRLAAFISVMGTPLMGIALSSYAVGIAPTAVFGGRVDTQVVGTLVAALAVLPVGLARSKAPTPTLTHAVLVPVAAALALAVCALPGATTDVRLAASYSLFSIVSVMALAVGCGISNAREFSRTSVFAALVGTHCLAAMLGLATGVLMDEAAARHTGIVVALCAAYGVLTIAVACRRAAIATAQSAGGDEDGLAGDWPSGMATASRPGSMGGAARAAATGALGPGLGSGSGLGPGPAPVAVSVEERAERLAARFELTPRETEIVRILARGHGCTYVAETLLISKSTVYTHVRNMYRKLGVSSHDELIALLDQQA